MRFARKLTLLATMAIAALALAAPSAFGQSLEITNEATGAHCGSLTVGTHSVSGGCQVNAVSETMSNGDDVVLRQHIFGIESTVTECTNQFTANLNEDGEGYLTNQVLGGAACSREPCNEEASGGAQDPWHGTGREDDTGSWLRSVFCVTQDNQHSNINCTVDVPFSEVGDHNYEFGHANGTEMPGIGTAGFRCELQGHWANTGATSGVEVTHL